jgi:dephospho-CoA kinase
MPQQSHHPILSPTLPEKHRCWASDVIAVTGSIGSGKSTFCGFLEELGAVVVYADAICHELLAGDVEVVRALQQLCGPQILNQIDGAVSRETLRQFTLHSRENADRVEAILRPRIMEGCSRRVQEAASAGRFPIFVELPLLFERDLDQLGFLSTVVVATTDANCVERVAQRGGISAQQVKAILEMQLPVAEKVRRADAVITNDHDIEALRQKALDLVSRLRAVSPERLAR